MTTKVLIPRYRLAVRRQVAEERQGQDLAREVARAAVDEANRRKIKAILNV